MKLRRICGLIAAAALVLWTALPTTSHVPSVIQTLQDHAEMIATHGHSHGLEEDLAWAMHGHSHDKADHDHMSAVLLPVAGGTATPMIPAEWHGADVVHWSPPVYRLERPPRL